MAHFDTVANAPGASDNGAAVSALLELIRMLGHHPPLENDIIFLFTDGEEQGLLGASAFTREHNWLNDVKMVINLEAMGSRGQSIMFETGDYNLNIIKEFAAAVPYPAGYSLSVEIYRRMPNITDFDVFKKRNIQGLNFAYIGNSFDYHTAGDNLDNIDLRSVQHHGSHAAALALHLGSITLDFEDGGNAVFFNTLGYGFVFYPYSSVIYISVFTALVLFSLFVAGIFKGRLSVPRLAVTFVSFSLFIAVIYVLFNSLYTILASMYPGSDHRLLEYRQDLILASSALITLSLSAGFYITLLRGVRIPIVLIVYALMVLILFLSKEVSWSSITALTLLSAWLILFHRKAAGSGDIFGGTLFFWCIIMLITSFYTPGASFLFTWPLISSMAGFAFLLFNKKTMQNPSLLSSLFFLLMSIPAIAWFTMIIKLFNQAMGLGTLGMSMMLAAIAAGLLAPLFGTLRHGFPKTATSAIFLCGLALLMLNTCSLNYNSRHRRQNNIMYLYNASTGAAYWLSHQREKPDEWTAQFLSSSPDTVSLGGFIPGSSKTVAATLTESHHARQHPVAELISDSTYGESRRLKIRVLVCPFAASLDLFIDTGNMETSLKIPGLEKQTLHPVYDTKWRKFTLLAPAKEDLELEIITGKDKRVGLQINSYEPGYVPIPHGYEPRQDYMMPAGDMTILSNMYIF